MHRTIRSSTNLLGVDFSILARPTIQRYGRQQLQIREAEELNRVSVGIGIAHTRIGYDHTIDIGQRQQAVGH